MAIKHLDAIKFKKLKKKKKMQKRRQLLQNSRRQRLLEEEPERKQLPPEFRARPRYRYIHEVPVDRRVDILHDQIELEDLWDYISLYLVANTFFSFGYLLYSSETASTLFQDFMFSVFSTALHR